MSSRFSTGQKLSFGMGSFAQWFINSAFNIWVFTYYFTVIGLDVRWYMLAAVLWTIWNAFNDPLIGFLSDRTNTKFGRRKPFIMLGSIPIIILYIIIWLPPLPAGGNEIFTFLYLLLMLILYDTFYTMVALPYDSLFPELYTSVKERSQVNTIRQILAVVGLLAAALVPGIVVAGETAPLSEQRFSYFLNGVITAIIIGVSLLVSLKWGVKERKEFKLDYQQQPKFIQSFKYAMKNKGFVLYTIMFFLYEYILLLLATLIQIFGREILDASPFETSILMGIMYIVGLASVALWKWLDVKIGSKKGYAIAIVAYFFASLPLMFVDIYLFAVIIAVFMGIGFGGMLYFIYLIIADVIDEDELKTGIRREGAFFGITNFFMRLSMILSIVTIGIVFVQTGWEVYNPLVDVRFGLRLLFIVIPGIALGISLICLYFFPYSKSYVHEMKEKLTELHESKMGKVKSS
ncbi:MAG: MFS transporter [Candidatus Lokiarchaeota archaeon]|nr:MFS transporter [Candidatus Lokiarchaeota archaeon]